MFGSLRDGKIFLDEHVVVKAVRDGARYASRQGFSQYACPAATVSTDVTNRTRNIVRYGKPNPVVADPPRLSYWQALSDGQPSVQVLSDVRPRSTGPNPRRPLRGEGRVPIVTVLAVVEYSSPFRNVRMGRHHIERAGGKPVRGDGHMKSRTALRAIATGASAAEFAMVLPLLILFLFGIIDVGV